MKINAYYQDRRFKNKKMMFLFNIKEKFLELVDMLSGIAHIKEQGSTRTRLQVESFFKPSVIVDNRLKYSFNHGNELNYMTIGKYPVGKIAVYTAVYGDYDPISQPLYKSKNCDYYAFTDQPLPKKGIWQVGNTDVIPNFEKMDDYHKSKYCKMFPHKLFPGYDYSIWIDGNVQIVADMYPLVDRLEKGKFMGAFMNPLHDCIYTEAKYNISKGYAAEDALQKQVQKYKSDGFPAHFGMREFSVIVRKHNNSECKQVMDEWWKQVNQYTMRDQISMPYILWKSHKSIDEIQVLGQNWRWNPRFIWSPHKWHVNYGKEQ